MIAQRIFLCFLFAAAAAMLLHGPAARGDDLAMSQVLVAKRQLLDPFYRQTVVLVRPIGNDQHIGLILNRPTKMTLGQLFPEHGPSQKVPDPVYVGGPNSSSVLFALVQSKSSPGGKSLRLLPDLYIAFEGDTVDRIIETDPAHARFLAGLVTWQPGELRDELKRGAWFVMDADPSIVLRKQTDGMWEELVRRAELRANAI
ncbi:MAG: YqgE/AlgH family protein [Betaproteobacteria bacterium]|nr:YqgE/AlgH family protein [Betaproteobacteria bacterium]